LAESGSKTLEHRECAVTGEPELVAMWTCGNGEHRNLKGIAAIQYRIFSTRPLARGPKFEHDMSVPVMVLGSPSARSNSTK
jgi:hypothetical protein